MDHTHFNYGWSPEESRLLHEWGHAENFRREMRDMQERNDREFAAFREQSEKFNARVERVRSQRDEILARLQKMAAFLPEYQHADGPGTHQETAGERLKKDTRGRVLNAIQRLEQDYQREGAIVDSAGDRKYALIGNLERMLANYERQTEGFTREMRTTAMDHWNKTEAAYSRYDKTGNAIRRDRGVRNAQAEVTAATAAVQKAEEKEVDDGVATLATETATAKTKAETARTKANTAETAAKKVEKDLTDAKALKEKETENANKLKDLTKEHDDLIGTGIPAATKEHGDAINDAILAGVDKPEERGLIDKLTRETAATIKLIEEVKPPYDAAPWDPAKRTAEITRLKTVLETKKTKINDVLEKRKKLNELNKKKKDYEGPTGEIQKLTDEIARNKIVTDKIPDLETKAKAARGKVKPLEDAAKEAEAEFKKLNDDLTEKQKPKKAAEAKLTAARAKLVAAEGLARTRIPSIEGDKAYRQNAFGAIHQIDEEGQHLWRHFRSIESVNEAGDSIDVKERMKDLLGRKTTILVDVLKTELKKPGNLADVTDLPVKEGTLRSAVGAARKELSFLMENGADREARITELTDLVSNLTGKMRTMLAAESNGALAPASRLKPAEKYAAVQREIYYLEQHHAEDPAAVARLKVLQGEEGLSGKLKDILWEQHSALHAATERALDLVRKGAKYDTIGNEQLEPARDSVRAEVLFLKKFPYDAPRFAQLKTDWDGLNRVRVERNALALRQEADRTVKEAGSRGGASRFGAMEALESEARDVRARGGKPEEMNRIKEQRDAQADLSVREALQAADVALVSRDRRAMHAAVNTVTSALDFMEKVEDRIPAGKMAELKGRLTALRQSLAVVNEEQIRNALAPDAAPGNIRETYLCIRDEMRMLRENKHYQRDIMASGRQRDLSISLTQVVQRLDNEITAIHKNMKDGASIQRGLELIAVEREFRTTMEMQLHPGMPEPNTYWIGELAKMEADLNREIGTVKEEKEGTRAVVTAELKKILGQISSVEAEADLEKKRTFLPWLEEQERFFKAGADRNPELVATFLPRIQEQLRLTRTFEQSRDAFARDLQALTGKVDQQTQRILQAYAKLTERGGGTLAEKTKQLQDHVAAGTALQKEAQAALTYAQDPGWKKQIDTTAITQAITVLGGRITDGQNAVDSLAGGRGAPPAPPAAPGGGGSRRSRPPLTA